MVSHRFLVFLPLFALCQLFAPSSVQAAGENEAIRTVMLQLARDGDVKAALERVAEIVPLERVIALRLSRWEEEQRGEERILLTKHLFAMSRSSNWVRPDAPPRDGGIQLERIEVRNPAPSPIGGRLVGRLSADELEAIASGPLAGSGKIIHTELPAKDSRAQRLPHRVRPLDEGRIHFVDLIVAGIARGTPGTYFSWGTGGDNEEGELVVEVVLADEDADIELVWTSPPPVH